MEVKFVLCRLVQAFGSIEMVETIGDKVIVVDAGAKEKMKTKMAFNTKPAEVVWLRFSQWSQGGETRRRRKELDDTAPCSHLNRLVDW
jgi:hypothetical protein